MMDLGMTGYQLVMPPRTQWQGDLAVVSDTDLLTSPAAGTNIFEFVVPVHAEIIAFGVVIVEDFVAHATDPVVSLKRANTVGGSETTLKSLTVGSSNTRLSKGNGTSPTTTGVLYPKDNVTAIAADTDLDTGDVVYADLSEVADSGETLTLKPGHVLIFEHTTVAGEVGGEYIPFAIIKFSGPDFTAENVWREVQDGETAGSGD